MRHAVLALSLSALVTYATAGHALSGGPVDGRVLEYDTGKPVEGAFVVARWEGELYVLGAVQSRSVCVHAEMAVSDKDGFFHIPPWAKTAPVEFAAIDLDAYKAGFESTLNPLMFVGGGGKWVVFSRENPREILQTYFDRETARAATHPENVYMKPFVGSASERVTFITTRVARQLGCYDAGAAQRNVYPVAKAVYQEAKSLAATPADQKMLSWIRNIAEDIWLALPPEATGPSVIPDEIKRELQ